MSTGHCRSPAKLARYGFGDGHPFGPDRHAAFCAEFAPAAGARRADVAGNPCGHTRGTAGGSTPRTTSNGPAASSRAGQLDGGDTPAYRGVFEAASYVVGAHARRGRGDHGGRRRRAPSFPIAGLHHAGRGRRGFLRLQRLRRRHRSCCAAAPRHRAHRLSTSTRTMATACSTPSSPTRGVIFADLHEDGHPVSGAPGSAETGRRGGRHQAQHPAAARRRRRRSSRRTGPECWPPREATSAGVHPAAVRRRRRRGRSDHAPALFARKTHGPGGRDLAVRRRPAGPRARAGDRAGRLQPQQSRPGLECEWWRG